MSLSQSRVVMISGANRGIGAAVAAHLAAAGWALSLGMRKPQPGAAGALVWRADADDPASETAWVAATLERFGRIDALVCNAGLMIPRNVIDITDTDMAAMFSVNVLSPQRLARAAWPALRVSGRGRVVILASLSGLRVATVPASSYSMTKFAAVALAHGLRQTGWADGIRATAICPGFVNTDMGRAVTDFPAEDMTQPAEISRLVELALDLPNNASVAELAVCCRAEARY